MKKTALATAVAFALGAGTAQAATMTSASFTLYTGPGSGISDNSVTGSIGGGTWSVASTTSFRGLLWTAHGGTTFGPGTYTIDTIEGGVYTGIVVGPGQVGGHILFDWNVSTNMDIINVWDINTVGDERSYTSTDIDGDGTHGIAFLDGPFIGSSVNFDFTTPVPIPPAIWLFGSGLLGLVGMARRRRN